LRRATLKHFGASQPLYVCKEIQTFGEMLSASLHLCFQPLNENQKLSGIAGTKNKCLKNYNGEFETNCRKNISAIYVGVP